MKETKIFSTILILLFSFIAAFGIQTKDFWDDSVRVAVIWNDGTGSDGMRKEWDIAPGEIGDSTRAFVRSALESLNQDNIYEVSARDSVWPSLSLDINEFKQHFVSDEYPEGQLPTAIIYINAGYIWGQHTDATYKPYSLLKEAADLGIGIVAIGDDAAADAADKDNPIFPELKGPDTTGTPIVHQGYGENNSLVTGGLSWPYMQDAIYWGQEWDSDSNKTVYKPQDGYKDLLIWINKEENKKLPDNGLLWNVNTDTLRFLDWGKDGRGQADADMWAIRDEDVTVAARIGFQTARYIWDGENTVIPRKSDNNPEAFKAIAALQRSLNRVVMLGYQPQYLADSTASRQIIYNSLFWASNAKELLKIPDLKATPSKGNPNTIGNVKIEIDEDKGGIIPPNDLYEIWYTTNGEDVDTNDEDSQKYDGEFPLGPATASVTLKAKAISLDESSWQHSAQLKLLYEYVGGPLITSARLIPGAIDLNSSNFDPDTLKVTFSEDMKDINGTDVEPFNLLAEDNENYTFKLKQLSKDGKTITFEVTGITTKNSNYWPNDKKDSIQINPDKDLEDISGTVQDGSNNYFVALAVDKRTIPQIAVPEADPSTGNTQIVKEVVLSVSYPADGKYYKLRFAVNGDVDENSDIFNDGDKITLPAGTGKDVVIQAKAYSTDKSIWLDSDPISFTYAYVGGPIIDSAILQPGSIEDPSTSTFAKDTLFVKFTKDMKQIDKSEPFISFDKDGNEYRFELSHYKTDGNWVTFIVDGYNGKPDDYLPNDREDKIKIDVAASVTATDNTIQDEMNNARAELIVRERKLPKIDTPVPSPDDGEITQKIDTVKLSVSLPDETYYTIRYEINGDVTESSKIYDDGFVLPDNVTEDVVITARAFSDSTHLWESSEICTVTYKYSPPPVLDSAVYFPGGIEDPQTSKMAPDTLVVYFDQSVEKVSGSTPFIFWDEKGSEYTINLKNINDDGSVQTFEVTGFAGKDDDYLPQHLRDQITIDPGERITSENSGIYQDGSNNDTIPLIVKQLPSNVKVSSIWFDKDDDNFKDLRDKLNNIPFDEGTLILVDPYVRLSDSELQKYTGSMVVLDMLGHRVMSLGDIFTSSGNVIAQKIEINGRTQFAVVWDGTNTKGRRVGSAAYLAVIEIVDNTGKSIMERAMIPVKKRKK